MDIHRQSQFELFPRERDSSEQASSSSLTRKNCVVSLEHMMMGGVALIVMLVISFSFGVERGKEKPSGKVVNVPVIDEQETVASSEEERPEAETPVPQVNEGEIRMMTASLGVIPGQSGNNAQPETSVPAVNETASLTEGAEKKIDKNYTIQVASFRLEKYAREEVAQLEKKGYEAVVMPKGKYSIVCVGKFAQKGEAEKAAKELKKRYKDYVIRSL